MRGEGGEERREERREICAVCMNAWTSHLVEWTKNVNDCMILVYKEVSVLLYDIFVLCVWCVIC